MSSPASRQRVELDERDARVVALPLFLFLAGRRALPLDLERAGADVGQDGVRDVAVHAADQRHHRDDRRHRDDVAQHGHERAQLAGPDGRQRERIGVEELLHARRPGVRSVGQVRSFGSSGLTMSPSFRSRTELNGPVMTLSPSFSPLSTSKYLSPAMPVLTGRKTRLLVADHEHALGFLPGLSGRQLIGRRSARPAALRLRSCFGCAHDLAGRRRRSARARPSPGSAPRPPCCASPW